MKTLIYTILFVMFTTIVLSQSKQVSDTIYQTTSETLLKELKIRKKYDVVMLQVNGEFHPMDNPYAKKNKRSSWDALIEDSSPTYNISSGTVSPGFYSSNRYPIITR